MGISASSFLASSFVICSILFYQHNIETLILTQYVFWITICDLFSALFFCAQLWPVWTANTPDTVVQLYGEDSHIYYGSPALQEDWGEWLKMFYFIEMFCTVASWLWWFCITIKVCNIMLRSKISFGSIFWEYGTIITISTVSVILAWDGISTVNVSTGLHERDWVVLRCVDESKCSQSGYIMVLLLFLGMLMLVFVLCRKRADAYVPRRILVFVSTYIFLWIPMLIVFVGMIKVDPHIMVISLAAPGLINAMIWSCSFSNIVGCCESRKRLPRNVQIGDLDSPLKTETSTSNEKFYSFRVVLNDRAESEFIQELEARRRLWEQVTEFLDHTPVNSLRSRPSLSWGSDLGVSHKFFNTA